ncbi:MAG: hypothetical protein ACLURV_01255 [Gallintestinimicrobium sp.]
MPFYVPNQTISRFTDSPDYQGVSAGRLNEKRKEHYEDILNGVAKHSSETERRADEAERICEKMKRRSIWKSISGRRWKRSFRRDGLGLYAELPNTVEGLVPVSSLRSIILSSMKKTLRWSANTQAKPISWARR